MSHPESPLILEELTSKFEKLEENLKKKKKVLASAIRGKENNLWIPKLLLTFLMVTSIFVITRNNIYPPEDLPGPWPRTAYNVAAVILLTVFGFAVIEGKMEQIAGWKRRRNTNNSPENGNETNENEVDNLMKRYQKLVEEDYVPMWIRYKRLCNLYIFYTVVGCFIVVMNLFSSVIDSFFYNTKQDPQNTYGGIAQLFPLILAPLANYRVIMNAIDEDNKIHF
ncbi:unnamed protein product [Caenorhabditis nigoni]